MNIYPYSCLKPLSNQLKAVFKQLKPCSNMEFTCCLNIVWIENPQEGTRFVYTMLCGKTLRLRMSILPVLLLTSMLIAEMTPLTFYVANQRHFVQWDTVYRWQNTIILIPFQRFGVILDWNQVKCKNNDHTYLFHWINICLVTRKMFGHSTCQILMHEKTCMIHILFNRYWYHMDLTGDNSVKYCCLGTRAHPRGWFRRKKLSLNWPTSPCLELREKLNCIEHIGKSKLPKQLPEYC